MFKLRMMTVWVVLVVAASAGAYWLISDTTHGVARSALDERLDNQMEQLRLGLAVRARTATENVDSVARMTALASALTPPPTDAASMRRVHGEVWSLLEGVNLRVAADMLWVTTADGRVVARQGDRNAFGDGVAGFPAVAAALEGRLSDHLQVVDNRVMILVSAPLVDPRTPRIVGAVVAGYELGGEWLRQLAQRSGLSWSLVVNRRISADTLDESWHSVLLGAFSETMPAPGALASTIIEKDESLRAARVYRFGGGLADFESGLVASAPLPGFWLGPNDPRVQAIALATAFALLAGLALSWWLSGSLRRRAQHLAATLLEMRRTGTLVATVDPKLSSVEHRPFVDLLNTILSENNGKRERPTITAAGRSDVLTTLDSMVAIDDEPPPRPAASAPSQTQAWRSPAATPAPTADRDGAKAGASPSASSAPIGEQAPSPRNTQASKSKGNGKPSRSGAALRREAQNLSPIPEDDGEYFEQVYREFLSLRETLGQPVNTVNREKFLQNLETNKARIQEKTQCNKVRFTVFEKDGKASVKAAPAEG